MRKLGKLSEKDVVHNLNNMDEMSEKQQMFFNVRKDLQLQEGTQYKMHRKSKI